MKKWKIVCGYTAEDKEIIDQELIEAAKRRNQDIEMELIHRYRKQGISDYLKEHLEVQTVVLQEVLQQSSPYAAEDLIQLTDERHVNVVVSLNANHYGCDFMVALYNAGIYNAIFEKDAYADNLVQLMIQGRTRKEARNYYGIHDFIDDLEPTISQNHSKFAESKTSQLPSVHKKTDTKESRVKKEQEGKEIDISDLGGSVFQLRNEKWRKYERMEGN